MHSRFDVIYLWPVALINQEIDRYAQALLFTGV